MYIYFDQRIQCLPAFNGTFVRREEQGSVLPQLCALSAISSPQILLRTGAGRRPPQQRGDKRGQQGCSSLPCPTNGPDSAGNSRHALQVFTHIYSLLLPSTESLEAQPIAEYLRMRVHVVHAVAPARQLPLVLRKIIYRQGP